MCTHTYTRQQSGVESSEAANEAAPLSSEAEGRRRDSDEGGQALEPHATMSTEEVSGVDSHPPPVDSSEMSSSGRGLREGGVADTTQKSEEDGKCKYNNRCTSF